MNERDLERGLGKVILADPSIVTSNDPAKALSTPHHLEVSTQPTVQTSKKPLPHPPSHPISPSTKPNPTHPAPVTLTLTLAPSTITPSPPPYPTNNSSVPSKHHPTPRSNDPGQPVPQILSTCTLTPPPPTSPNATITTLTRPPNLVIVAAPPQLWDSAS